MILSVKDYCTAHIVYNYIKKFMTIISDVVETTNVEAETETR